MGRTGKIAKIIELENKIGFFQFLFINHSVFVVEFGEIAEELRVKLKKLKVEHGKSRPNM